MIKAKTKADLIEEIAELKKENEELRTSAVKYSMVLHYLRKIKKTINWEEI